MQQTKQIKKTKRTSLKKRRLKEPFFPSFPMKAKIFQYPKLTFSQSTTTLKYMILKKKKRIIQVSLINFLSILEASLKTKTKQKKSFLPLFG